MSEQKKVLKPEVKIFIWILILIALFFGVYILSSYYGKSTDKSEDKVLATYGNMKYSGMDLEKDKQLFEAVYAVNLLNLNVTEEQILNKTILTNLIKLEIGNLSYNKSFVEESSKNIKTAFLKNNQIDELAYLENYKAKGYTESDINDYFYTETLINLYVEGLLSQLTVPSEDVIASYNSNIDSFKYDDSVYVFKLIMFENKTYAESALDFLKDYKVHLNMSQNSTADQNKNAKNYLFTQLLNQYSVDPAKQYNRGIYSVLKELNSSAKDYERFLQKSASSLKEYEFSSVLRYGENVLDKDGNTVYVERFFLFERIPNTLTLVEVGDDIYQKLLLDKRLIAVEELKANLLKKYNVTYY